MGWPVGYEPMLLVYAGKVRFSISYDQQGLSCQGIAEIGFISFAKIFGYIEEGDTAIP